MSAPYLYTPLDNSARLSLGHHRSAAYAPSGYTPRHPSTTSLPRPSHYPLSRSSSGMSPYYDDEDDSDKVDGHNAFDTRDPPGPNNICPRPDYWRPTYPNRPRWCPLRRLFTTKIHLNPLLRYNKQAHPIRFDLRLPPSMDPQIYLPAFHRVPTRSDMRSLAARSDPSLHELHLWHRLLPWYITITTHINPRGITIRDILEQLHIELSRPIILCDYWTCDISDAEREQIDQACRVRTWTSGFRTDQPICRMDYLQQHYLFIGIVPSLDGTFEIKTTAPVDATGTVIP